MAISGTMAEGDLVKMKDAVVQVDIGGAGSAWAAIGSWSNSVEPTRGTVPISEEFTLDGEQHVSIGQIGTSRVRCTFFFTEDSTDPFSNLYAQLGEVVDIRWSKSGTANDLRFYSSNGVLIDAPPPGFNATNNESTKVTIEIACTDIVQETIPT
jgi:hypothetical protein